MLLDIGGLNACVSTKLQMPQGFARSRRKIRQFGYLFSEVVLFPASLGRVSSEPSERSS
jgi:hypothetical protein